MRKHRKWWMGFGIGIVLGASMLQLILFAQDQQRALQEAAEGPKLYSQADLDEAVEQAVQEALSASASSESPASPSGSAAAAPDTSSSVPSPSPASSPAESTQPERIVSFYINQGMDLKTVARSLKRLGIIEDAEDFTDEARTIAKDIQPGTSVFTGRPTYKEIIAELVRVKDD